MAARRTSVVVVPECLGEMRPDDFRVEFQASQRRYRGFPDLDLLGSQQWSQPGERGLCRPSQASQRLCGDRPEFRRRIVEQSGQCRDGLGSRWAVTSDQFRGRKPHLRVRTVQLPDDDRQRLATRRTQGTDGIDRVSLHPSVGVVEQDHQITEQAIIAWCRLKEDADGLDANPRGFVFEHGTHGRYAFAGSRTEVTRWR